ncbi:DUF2971 domain-containing protein [Chitinimonas naiadis]
MLYKYRKFDLNGIGILINKEIFCARPSTLNDPADSTHNIKQIIDDYIDSITDPHRSEVAEYLRLPLPAGKLNSGELNIYEMFHNVHDATGIFSASRVVDNAVMWSHYADNHSGFCIGFVEEELLAICNDHDHSGVMGFDDVNYKEQPDFASVVDKYIDSVDKNKSPEGLKSRVLLGDFIPFVENLTTEFYSTKDTSWSYEQEWRMVTGVSKAVSFAPKAISEIVIGSKTAPFNIKLIKNLLNQPQWSHVTLKRANFMPGTTKMAIKDLSD